MADVGIGPGERELAEVIATLRDLTRSVQSLSTRVAALERRSDSAVPGSETPGPPPEVAAEPSMWGWVGQSRLLPRIAMVCFVLVIALVLRTLTESGVLERRIGVWAGVGYCGLLVAWGWRQLARDRRGQRVLPACGIMLFSVVLFEAQGGAGGATGAVLTSTTAEWMLLAALVTVAALGLRHRSSSVVAFALVTTSLAATAMGFPHIRFPPAATVILAGSAIAIPARRVGNSQWLPWAMFGIAMFFWLSWGFQIDALLRHGDEPAVGLAPRWYLPLLAAFAILYGASAALLTRSTPGTDAGIPLALPTLNVLWAYGAAHAARGMLDHGAASIAVIGALVALLHFAVALGLARRAAGRTDAIASFTIAGTVLLASSTPRVLGGLDAALPLWSALALALVMFGTRIDSAGLRLASYALQLLAGILAWSSDPFSGPSDGLAAGALSSAAIAVLAALHFRYARRHPSQASGLLARFVRPDRCAIAMLWVAAAMAFGVLRILAHRSMTGLGADVPAAFPCVQSVIVNLASVVLMLWATRMRDRDVLITAVLVGIVGALRVVGSDLPNGRGVPLVLAVASFGLAAAVGSVVLGKWQSQRSVDRAA
ncbi:MAG: hypothetical protein IPM29_17615 [Planctomycetes bacterium]|nr:hypothetical protein [Planctomycetota bacterium]